MSDSHDHGRAIATRHPVTPLELFFDLVFVFALTQVTTLMADDPTWLGLLRGFAVLAAIWWAWAGYAWLTSTVNIDDDLLSRLVMLVAMAAMLVVGLAAPAAFGEYSVLFGVAYLVVRLLHVTLYAVVSRHDADVLGAVRRLATGIVLAPLLILAAGFLPAGPVRAVLWAAALIVDFGSPLVAGTSGWKVDAGHFAERHGLVIIIALGESVVAVGVAAAGEPLTSAVVTAATLSVVIVASMWWLYFDVVALAAERKLHALTGRDQAAMARDSYSYLHLFMVWGIVLVALGLKKSLADLHQPLSAVPAVALLGGLAVYLLAHVAFRLRNMRTVNVQRLITAALLVLLVPVALRVESLVTIGMASTVMVVLVGYEVIRFREGRHNLRHHSPGQPH